jgi:arginyl-tRNA synthetase
MIKQLLQRNIAQVLRNIGLDTLGDGSDFVVEHPEDLSHGDYATNVALVYAKKAGMSPRALAEKIAGQISEIHHIKKVDIAGPGFINFHIAREYFAESIADIITRGAKFGSNDLYSKSGVNNVIVEYTDPNPFKEFHIGHLMSNAIGESIARIIGVSGAEVKRACYQGDVGLHVAKAIWGYLHGTQKELEKGSIKKGGPSDFGEAYVVGATAYDMDEQAKKEIIDINKKLYSKEDADLNALYDKGKKDSLAGFEKIYAQLGTQFDYYFFESETGPIGMKLVEEGLSKGIFEKSDGAIIFKGDEEKGLHTRVFINSNGLPTYEAKELGLIRKKYESYPYDLAVVITGNEVRDYFKVLMDAAAHVFANSKIRRIQHIPHGMLRLPTGKMSSRKGGVISAASLIDDTKMAIVEMISGKAGSEPISDNVAEEIAIGAIKYSILRQGSGEDIIYDVGTSVSLEGDSGPYLQYSAVRAKSIREKAADIGIVKKFDAYPAHASDIERVLYRFPEIVEYAARKCEPHYIATYLISISALFNNYYAHNQIVSADDPHSPYRVALTHAFETVMRNGLSLLGIAVPERM